MKKFFIISLSIVISTFLAVNAILLFSNKSQIARSYYINEFDRVYENTYAKELEKEAIIVPANETTVTVDVDAVSDIKVVEGDAVQQGEELAQLKTDSADEQRRLWESEEQAYIQEQSQLNQIITDLESERGSADSNSSGSGNTTGNTSENVIDVNVQVDVNVSQDSTFAQAIAETEGKLAEVERKLQIVSAQLSQESGEMALLSPIEGNIAAIEERNGKYFIDIYANEKSIITFANEEQWHQIEEGQEVRNYSTYQEGLIVGSILSKALVPANASKWLTAYEQVENKSETPLYEVKIQIEEELTSLPFAANINSAVVTNNAENAMRVKGDWLLNRSNGKAQLYTLTNDGYIALVPVTVPFDIKKYAILSEGLQTESVVLNEESKNIGAQAFLPFPLDLPTWESVKSVSWKDYLKYLTYK